MTLPSPDATACVAQTQTVSAYQPVDLAALAGPVVTGVETHLYIADRSANGETGRRTFLCTVPAGAHLLPMAVDAYALLAVPTAHAVWESSPLEAGALERWQTALAQAPFLAGHRTGAGAVRVIQADEVQTDEVQTGGGRAENTLHLAAETTLTARAPLWICSAEAAFAFTAAAAERTPLAVAPLGPGWVIDTAGPTDATVLSTHALLAAVDEQCIREIATAWASLAAAWVEREAQHAAAMARQSRQNATDAYQQSLTSIAQSATGVSPAQQTEPHDRLRAALRILGQLQGFTVQQEPQAELDKEPDKEPDGDPDRWLTSVAQASRIRMRRVTLGGTWWREAGVPLLGFDAQGQALVLRPARRGYVAQDPVSRARRPVDAELATGIAERAYQLYATLPARLTRRALVRFALHGAWGNIAWMLVASLLVTLLGLVTPIVMGAIVRRALPTARLDILAELVLVLVAVAVNITLFRIIEGLNTARFTNTVDLRLQPAIWDRVMRLPSRFFRRYGVGDLASRVLGIKQIATTLTGTAVSALLAGVMSVTSFGLMAWYSPMLTRFAVIYGLLVALLLGLLTRRQVRWAQRTFQRKGAVQTVTLQLLSGIAKLRVAAAEERAFARWGTAYADERANQMRGTVMQNITAAVLAVIPIIGTLGLFFLVELERHALDVAAFIAFYTAFGQFIAAVLMVSQTSMSVLNVAPLYRRVQPVLREPPEVNPGSTDPGVLSGAIAVRHVTFRYHDAGPDVLHDVSFDVQPGEFVAIVGPSGAGKSTILRLLLGFEQPTTGVISYDNQELARLDVQRVRQQIGTVLQDVGLMPGSIYENIAGAAAVSRADVMEAARLVGLAEDIEKMPMGLETMVSEGGGNLSGGQRQRLIIARVLVRKPRLIFFDEATSALDNQTQAVVTESLARFQTTRLVIAHRLSTIRGADKILVLEEGRIVQRGTFDSLMAQDGLFQKLVRRQLA